MEVKANDISFLPAIDNLDKCLQGNLTDEQREYILTLKKLFISIEETTINMKRAMEVFLEQDIELN